MDQEVEESLMVCYSPGFPQLPRLKCACLHTAALQVLKMICRQCNSLHLKSLLPRHQIRSWKALKDLVGDHVRDLHWVVNFAGITFKECGEQPERLGDISEKHRE